jgi:hypothetical protein
MSYEFYRFPFQFEVELHLVRQICRDGLPFPHFEDLFDFSFVPAEIEGRLLGDMVDGERSEDPDLGSGGVLRIRGRAGAFRFGKVELAGDGGEMPSLLSPEGGEGGQGSRMEGAGSGRGR